MTQVIILAAGKGARMHNGYPKALTSIKGVSFLDRVIRASLAVCKKPNIVVGYRGDEVIAATGSHYPYIWQREQLGTGHAVRCAKAALMGSRDAATLVLNGDHPLTRSDTLTQLVAAHEQSGAVISITTAIVPHFQGDFALFSHYGRVVRARDGKVERIVEYKDASEQERAIREVNVNCYCFQSAWLWRAVDLLEQDNNAHEYYLTDLVKIASESGEAIHAFMIADCIEGMGVNTPEQLAIVEKYIGA